MNIDDQKSLALKACINIAASFSSEQLEVLPEEVKKAHAVGRIYFEAEKLKDKKALKDFVI